MKRVNPWKILERTFASTPIATVKRKKISRKSVNNSNDSRDQSHNFQIEDSDEENETCVKELQMPQQSSLLKQPKKLNSKVKSSAVKKPLLINTSLNMSIENSSFVWDSGSDESIDGEPVLQDVSMCQLKTRSKKARSKSLLFLSKDEQIELNNSLALKNCSPVEQKLKSNGKTGFNNSIGSCLHRVDNANETISDSDSLDETDSSTKQCENMQTEVIKRQHSADIVFTQNTENSNPIIESENSQFSLKLESQQPRVQRQRLKCKKTVKGGLVEQLNKAMNTNKSEYSFWMNERQSNLIEPGEKMRIDKIERSYGRILLHCTSIDSNNSNIVHILCVDPSFKKLTMLKNGKTIEIGFETGYSIDENTLFYPNVTKILV